MAIVVCTIYDQIRSQKWYNQSRITASIRYRKGTEPFVEVIYRVSDGGARWTIYATESSVTLEACPHLASLLQHKHKVVRTTNVAEVLGVINHIVECIYNDTVADWFRQI